jgi:two-component system response regulator PilR (NtrC family)
MEEGRFREDLYYRLNVVQMVMPALRNRKDDIPALAHYFLRKFATSHGKQVEEISSGALMRLMNHNFPGNVRELENVMEHAVAVTNRNIVTEDDLPHQVKNLPSIAVEIAAYSENGTKENSPGHFFSKGVSLDAELETHERAILVDALRKAKGVQKKAAELLGINYRSLRHRLDKYDLLGKSHNATADDHIGE